jgi:O-methyltransferase
MKNDKFMNWARSFMRRRIWWMLPPRVIAWILAQQNISRVDAGYRLVPEKELEGKFIKCLQRLSEWGITGDYLEFGVFCGSSLSCMFNAAERTGQHNMRFFGFDSFKGLPAGAAEEGWREGDYCMCLEYARKFMAGRGVDFSRTCLIDGWFSETLNEDTKIKYGIDVASVVMVDCDLYSSSIEALDFAGPLLSRKSFLIFDDWHSLDAIGDNLGQKKAFPEFLRKNPGFTATPFDSYGKNGRIFMVEKLPDCSETTTAAYEGQLQD